MCFESDTKSNEPTGSELWKAVNRTDELIVIVCQLLCFPFALELKPNDLDDLYSYSKFSKLSILLITCIN